LNIGPGYLILSVVDDDPAIHFGQLGETLSGKRGVVEMEAATRQLLELWPGTDDNEGAGALGMDQLNCDPERSARRKSA